MKSKAIFKYEPEQIVINQVFFVINKFCEKYFFLSNFYPAPVTCRGLTYKNNEATFQAQKCMTEEEKVGFTNMSPPERRVWDEELHCAPTGKT